MDQRAMFKGLNKDEWEKALAEQNDYLKKKYGADLLANRDIQTERLNESAAEAKQFLFSLSAALCNRWKADDERVQTFLKQHIQFLNAHGTKMDVKSFVSQSRFFLEDDFHRNMLESQQVGLSYYLYAVAEKYAATEERQV